VNPETAGRMDAADRQTSTPAGWVASWDDAETVRRFERFCRTHDRYAVANSLLADHAGLESAARVLDVAAGTGRTAQAALERMKADTAIVCWDPSCRMRETGISRIDDPRLSWSEEMPQVGAEFDRILCGAGIWQLLPLEATLGTLAQLLVPGGLLAFNIPSLYLGEPDEPGGGQDPLLLRLPAILAEGRAPASKPSSRLPTADGMEALMLKTGLRPQRWTFRLKLTQQALRDWLKIPVMTEGILGGIDPDERDRRIDRAYRETDPDSWRWERWTGWTAARQEPDGPDSGTP